MKHDKKSKWKMAWNLLNQPAQGEKDSELLIYILAIIPMILIITYWHLYREPFFYIGFLTMFGWVYLWRKSDKLKPNFSSKLVNKLATFGLYFLVYFILGLGVGVFSLIF